MRVGSLFTGYGGLDMAVGGDLVWYAEIEPAACQVLAHHHPDVPNLGDIKEVDWSQVEPVDIITGGYPCQPFSHAGNRKGKNDVRHLWPYVLDAIRAIRPKYAILENVSGHLTLGFADVLADLAEIGWFAEWGTYRASDVGAPHRRERIFIVACNPDNNGRSASERGRSLREGTVARGSYETSGNGELKGASDSLIAHTTRGAGGEGQGWGLSKPERSTGLATHAGNIAADTINNGLQHASERVDARQGEAATQGHWGTAADTSGERHGSGERSRVLERVGSQAEVSGWQTSTARQKSGTGSVDDAANADNGHGQTVRGVSGFRRGHASRPDMPKLSEIDWGKYAPAITRWELTIGRLAPAPTVERKDKRRLNPQFVEWMMGLPDGWVTGHGLSAAKELKMLGNGVVPQQAHAAITQLMERTA